jgi:hypothetical protein
MNNAPQFGTYAIWQMPDVWESLAT